MKKISASLSEYNKEERFIYKIFDKIVRNQYLTRFRIISIESWDKKEREYIVDRYVIQVNFFHIPFWWLDVSSSRWFSNALEELQDMILLQEKPKKARVIHKDEEIIELMKEEND
jgi:hypothetical protein